jgi:DNA-binding protein H-NS
MIFLSLRKIQAMATALSPYEQHLEDIAAAESALNKLKERGKPLRDKELYVLAEGYWFKAKKAGFTVKEAKDALTQFVGDTDAAAADKPNKTRAKRGTATPKEAKAYEPGQQYKDPKSNAVWTGGTKGRMPPWLSAKFEDGMSVQEKAKIFQSIAVN